MLRMFTAKSHIEGTDLSDLPPKKQAAPAAHASGAACCGYLHSIISPIDLQESPEQTF